MPLSDVRDNVRFSISRQVLPLSVLFTSMIATNNLCLKYVDVSFYYIGRSLTTVFNVIFSYLLIREATSIRCILCCALIISGFWLGVDQERVAGKFKIFHHGASARLMDFTIFFFNCTESFSLLGTIFGVLGSISLSLCSIYTKKTLPKVSDDVLLLGYYNNIYASIMFVPLIFASGEFKTVSNYEHLWEFWFWSALIVGGICGFSIGFVTSLQIKFTSPLTHNISGTAKACAQTILATNWNHESKSVLWWLSNFIVLLGSSLYVRVKQIEMERKFHYQRLSQNI